MEISERIQLARPSKEALKEQMAECATKKEATLIFQVVTKQPAKYGKLLIAEIIKEMPNSNLAKESTTK